MGFGGSGSSSIAGSSDVALNVPVNNNVLTFDSTTSKWKNAVPPAGSSNTEWGVIPTLYINTQTQVWPARTLPNGYSGAVRWDSLLVEDAPAPTNMTVGDRWARRVSNA